MSSENNDNIMLGDIQISPQHNTMTKGESVCRLQPKVMALLCYLHKHNDRVVANDELLEHVWEGRVVTHNSIQKSINALRATFAELDANTEYVAYFSKRGYQLITSDHNQAAGQHNVMPVFWRKSLIFIALLGLMLLVLYSAYVVISSSITPQAAIAPLSASHFSQVKPYVSNTGRERIIEPFTNSDRVAFVRDESDTNGSTQSRLYVHGASGHEWQISVARGDFVDLAWSASGRNLVAVDAHTSTAEEQETDNEHYYTFHIFTLDFKGEKLIEKNLLSHWQGKVSSVSWWDEGTIEFVASQGAASQTARYRYNIAEQNLIKLEWLQNNGRLLTTQLFNQVTAELRKVDGGMQIQFLDSQQGLIAERVFSSPIESISWMADGSAVLILSDEGKLSLLDLNGVLQSISYAPKVDGRILRARSSDAGNSIVLTVKIAIPESVSSALVTELSLNNDGEVSAMRFSQKGGGFIYTATTNKQR